MKEVLCTMTAPGNDAKIMYNIRMTKVELYISSFNKPESVMLKINCVLGRHSNVSRERLGRLRCRLHGAISAWLKFHPVC